MTDLSFVSLYDSPADGCAHLFLREGFYEVRSAEFADIIIFNGGTDIGTPIYHEKATYTSSDKLSARDVAEIKIFNTYPNKFKVGICRGAQLLNCLNGGTLWQDVNNHGRDHIMIDTRTQEKIVVTSTHHQMMRPNYDTGVIIGVADQSTEKRSEHDHWSSRGGVFFPDDHKDTEIVWYPSTQTLCVQGHPEYVPGSHFAKYFFDLLANCINEVMTCVV